MLYFRCMCPVSIVNRDTHQQRPKPTIIYLDDKYARLSFNISAPAGTECHNSVVVDKCVDECYKSGKNFALILEFCTSKRSASNFWCSQKAQTSLHAVVAPCIKQV